MVTTRRGSRALSQESNFLSPSSADTPPKTTSTAPTSTLPTVAPTPDEGPITSKPSTPPTPSEEEITALHRRDSDQYASNEESPASSGSNASTPQSTDPHSDDDTDAAIHADIEDQIRKGLEFSDDEGNSPPSGSIQTTMPIPVFSQTATAGPTTQIKPKNPLYNIVGSNLFKPMSRPKLSAAEAPSPYLVPPPPPPPPPPAIPDEPPAPTGPSQYEKDQGASKIVTYTCGRTQPIKNAKGRAKKDRYGSLIFCEGEVSVRYGMTTNMNGVTSMRPLEPIRCRECGSSTVYKTRTKRMVQFEAR